MLAAIPQTHDLAESERVSTTELYRPPAPVPLSPNRALLRSLLSGDRDLLSLLPAEAYRMRVGRLGFSRRTILLVNDPALVRQVMVDQVDAFPKNDLFVGALAPLIGEGVFISSGELWQRQRRMIEPAFSHMHLRRAFAHMDAAVTDFETRLDDKANAGAPFSLDAAMTHLTADIMYRAIFSSSLESRAAQEVFEAFGQFQESVANVQILRLILGKPWAKVRQPAAAQAACDRLRGLLRRLIAARLEATSGRSEDIAGDIIAARHPENGRGFELEELVDQIGVFFLAGHETTASTVTWALFILAQRPETVARVRAEIADVVGEGPLDLEVTKRLVFLRAVIKETLRLYPPGAFLPRVALRPVEIGSHRVPRGGMVMIAPWIIHRHRDLWDDPDYFDPDRFLGAHEKTQTPGAYLPFGLGPRVCVGGAFALTEGTLILARLLRRYRMEVTNVRMVRPVVRLTTRPASDIQVRMERA